MSITKVKFIKGVVGEDPIVYQRIPHVAFIGRSNVGKSSTLNSLVGRRAMAKVGKTPGKTKEINFFEATIAVQDQQLDFYLVDLPGYGYAKLSKQERETLRARILWYLTNQDIPLLLVVMIIDAKVGLTDLDREVLIQLQQQGQRVLVAVNKIDKLNQRQLYQLTSDLTDELGPVPFIAYSADKGKHTNKIVSQIELILTQQ